MISIHALLAESDTYHFMLRIGTLHFYPRSPCGERLTFSGSDLVYVEFLSTLSLRRATSCLNLIPLFLPYFYPRSPCGERQLWNASEMPTQEISIHALLAESDEGAHRLAHAPPHISIHALLAESDPYFHGYIRSNKSFLSTLSLRRATYLATW